MQSRLWAEKNGNLKPQFVRERVFIVKSLLRLKERLVVMIGALSNYFLKSAIMNTCWFSQVLIIYWLRLNIVTWTLNTRLGLLVRIKYFACKKCCAVLSKYSTSSDLTLHLARQLCLIFHHFAILKPLLRSSNLQSYYMQYFHFLWENVEDLLHERRVNASYAPLDIGGTS